MREAARAAAGKDEADARTFDGCGRLRLRRYRGVRLQDDENAAKTSQDAKH